MSTNNYTTLNMSEINAYRMDGLGNDFIIVDRRKNSINLSKEKIIKLGDRKILGFDQILFIEKLESNSYPIKIYNSDGGEVSACGNGARCIVSFAHLLDISSLESTFMAIDGIHKARIIDSEVSIKFLDINKVNYDGDNMVVESGSPHLIVLKDNINNIDVNLEGAKIRNMSYYKGDGININFIEINNGVKIRTYERGVESETLSCGTGAVASAIALYHNEVIEENIVSLQTRGGDLTVSFDVFNDLYKNIWLTGEVSLVYIGEFEC